MKKIFAFVLVAFLSMNINAAAWLETCGTDVSKNSSGYWPYTNEFTGWDHYGDVTYGGWYATVRYLGTFSANGPHVFMAATKSAYLTLDNVPGGEDCVLTFEAVCYVDGGESSYAASDALVVTINEVEYSLGSQTISASAFTPLTVSGKVTADKLSIKISKKDADSKQIRLDNFKVTPAGSAETYYTLKISAGEGGKVNTSVNGSYKEGSSVTIEATPYDGYKFAKWSDDNTSAKRTIEMTGNITLTAYFEEQVACAHPELEGKKGNEILNALYEQIKDHTVLSYDAVRADKAGVDIRSNGNVWDMYSDCSFTKYSYCGYGEDFSECDCYNREHSLPKSFWGGGTDEPMYSDLHHVIPTDFVANTNRSAWPYGEVTGTPTWSNSLGSKVGKSSTLNTTVFEPADEYKGDLARIYFYMATCYKDKNFTVGGMGKTVFSYSNGMSTFTYSVRNMLMKWHRADPVSQKEIDRNNAVAKKQGNRNPFVDSPDLAEYIWGTKKNEAYKCPATGIEEVESFEEIEHAAKKVMIDGHIYILRDGKVYTITGAEVR